MGVIIKKVNIALKLIQNGFVVNTITRKRRPFGPMFVFWSSKWNHTF